MKLVEILGIMIGVTGFAVLCITDWRVALGVFLMVWGNNLHAK